MNQEEEVALDKELLAILACPKCKGDVILNKAGDGLLCMNCKLLYEIEDGIPIMLIDEAKPFSEVEKSRLDVPGKVAGKKNTGKKIARKKTSKKKSSKKS